MKTRTSFLFVASATVLGLPGLYFRLAHVHLDPIPTAVWAGSAIMGAAFLLLWACDAAQEDISQALALAIVALIAVLPEYAVDMYFTWQAGQNPEGDYAQFAIANMTGANRLIIGVAWVVVVLITWLKTRKAVRLEKERRTEVLFLALATLYAFLIPIKGSLAWYDMLVFLGLYIWYMVLAGKRPQSASEAEGPAELLLRLPPIQRRLATFGMFFFAAIVILANAEPFCEGLLGTGKALGISEFLLVQWLAPIASETPEFVVAIMFALRGQGGVALVSLLAAKLNQWTLLVGMIPGVFAVSHRSLDHPIPMGNVQLHEILLTAAQSLLAVSILATMRMTIRHAVLLFVLFAGQLVTPIWVEQLPGDSFLGLHGPNMHQVFTLLYLMGAATLFLEKPARIQRLGQGLKG